MDNKIRPFGERVLELQMKLKELCKIYGIEIVPTLLRTPSSDQAQITMVDAWDDAMLAKYGLVRTNEPSDSSPDVEDKNPIAN